MAVRFHSVTSHQVRALAEGTSTHADLDLLAAGEVSKCLAMLSIVVRDSESCRHPEAGAAAAAWRLLGRVRHEAPGAVAELLRYPPVGAWATRLIASDEPARGPAVSPGQLSLIAAAAAIRGDVSCTVSLPAAAPDRATLHLPSLGTVVLPPGLWGDEITLRHHGGGTEIAGLRGRLALPRRLDADAPGWQALRTVRTDADGRLLHLVIDDASPHRLPEGAKAADPLTPAMYATWSRRVAGGWRILARDHRRTAAEVAAIIRTVVPLASGEGELRSVTSRWSFGAIGLSLPGDDLLMALTLAHEVQHAKLAALMDLVPLVTDPAAGTYYAPWRPDPRPLASLLQGMYAHLEVARFWRRHSAVATGAEARRASVEFAKWRNACAQVAVSVRGRPELTDCGSVLVDGMINAMRSWQNDSIPVEATAQADREISEHKRKWDARQSISRGTAST